MDRIDNAINCYTCKYFKMIHYLSKFIDFCDFFEEALPTNTTQDAQLKSGEKLLICKNFTLHEKFNNERYAHLISQADSFQVMRGNMQDKNLYSYFADNFHLCQCHEFEKE